MGAQSSKAQSAKTEGVKIETTYMTQVANGSNHDIYVLVDSYRSHIEKFTAQARDVAFFVEDEIFAAPLQMPHAAYLLGFTRIQPGDVVPFKPDIQPDKAVFISIYSVDGSDGRVEEICNCFGVPSDFSVVVGYDNQVYPIEHGKQWIEAGTGHDHFRHPNPNPSQI